MNVILLDEVENLGNTGDCVRVAKGYARNYLLPKGLAVVESDAALKIVESRRRLKEEVEAKALAAAQKMADKIAALSINLVAQVGEQDKLFGSITAMDIVKALADEGVKVDKKQVLLEEPIKSLGIYNVSIKLHPEVTAEMKFWVVKP